MLNKRSLKKDFKEDFNIDIITVIYRPPCTLFKDRNDEFQHTVRLIANENKFACVLGDRNVKTYEDSEHNNKHVADFSKPLLLQTNY